MAVLNGIDRFNLVLKTLETLPELPAEAGHLQGLVTEKLELHRSWIGDYGEDLPEVRNWRWGAGSGNVG
jgi:xylulose-5-phosphate/fructose-6-phosphate phosphoketolase